MPITATGKVQHQMVARAAMGKASVQLLVRDPSYSARWMATHRPRVILNMLVRDMRP